MSEYVWKRPDDSVLGIHPREALTITIKEYKGGWCGYAYTGDGTKPGSLYAAEFSVMSARDAFDKVMRRLRGEVSG
jgi:hypothetical protein